MADHDHNEMEQIKRGLEEFLEKELEKGREQASFKEGLSMEGGGFQEGNAYPEEEPLGDEFYPEGEGYSEYDPEGYSEADREKDIFPEEDIFPEGDTFPEEDGFSEGDIFPEEDGFQEEDVFQEEDFDEAQSGRGGAASGVLISSRARRSSRKKPAQGKASHRKSAYGKAPQGKALQGRSPRGNEMSDNTGSMPSGRNQKEEAAMAKKGSKKKKRRKKFRLLKVLLILAAIIGLLAFALYQLVGSVYGKMNYEEISGISAQPMEEEGVVNILLIGNDSRKNGTDGRSDAMILLSVSSKTKTIYMTSLLRDIYVEIPGREGNRLNAAYSFGGPELLMETIEQNFDISVNRYVSVNFEAFANLIDAVGGVDLELGREEIEYVNGYLVEYNMLTGREQGTDNMDPDAAGMVHLNGPQALAYCRNRYIGTDFGRTERQRKVLEAAAGKLPSALLNDYQGLMEGILPNLTTNLTQNECFSLSLMAGKLLTYDIVSDSIPQPGTYSNATIRKMAVLEVDFEANKRFLKEKIYGEVEE